MNTTLNIAKKIIKIGLNTIIIIVKLISSAILSYFLLIIPFAAIKSGKIDLQVFLLILFCMAITIFVNWSIWSRGIIKKIIMAISIIVLFIFAVIKMSNYLGIESDYCIEDGDCFEGYIIKDRPISEEYCKELNGKWLVTKKNEKYCKIDWVKNRINEKNEPLHNPN